MATTQAAPKVTSAQLKALAGRVGDAAAELERIQDPTQYVQHSRSLVATLDGIQADLVKAAGK